MTLEDRPDDFGRGVSTTFRLPGPAVPWPLTGLKLSVVSDLHPNWTARSNVFDGLR